MDTCDVLIVGGGPAGSTCARALTRGGFDVVVLDRATFPRDKPCAGWITPAVIEALDLPIDEYRQRHVFQPITAFRTSHLTASNGGGRDVHTRFNAIVSYGIRRCEFDHFLLQRSGARVRAGTALTSLRRHGQRWIANESGGDAIAAPLVIGAGGHFCPVARHLVAQAGAGATAGRMASTAAGGSGASGASSATAPEPLSETAPGPASGTAPGGASAVASAADEDIVAAQEIEVQLTPAQAEACRVSGETPELYLCADLEGYGWCFRKGPVLNVGLGRQDRHELTRHVREFVECLMAAGRIPRDLTGKWRGHAYLLRNCSRRPVVDEGALLIGDAAGLAYARSGEGIRPAVESGLLAAQTIVEARGRGRYRLDDLEPYRQRLLARFGPAAPPSPPLPAQASPATPRAQRAPVALASLPSSDDGSSRTAGQTVGLRQRVALRVASHLLANAWFTRHVFLERWFLRADQSKISVP